MQVRFDRDRLDDVRLTLLSKVEFLRHSSKFGLGSVPTVRERRQIADAISVPTVRERRQIADAITEKYGVEGQIDFVGGLGDNMIRWHLNDGTHILLLNMSDADSDMVLSYGCILAPDPVVPQLHPPSPDDPKTKL
jgi:hypothetical protein